MQAAEAQQNSIKDEIAKQVTPVSFPRPNSSIDFDLRGVLESVSRW